MGYTPRFWNWIAARYARQPVGDEKSYQLKLAKTQEYLDSDMQVLEFGCGTGSTALAHAPHVDSILAIDFAEKMIDIARQKAVDQGITNVDFKVMAIEDLPPSQSQFDAVLGLNVLHLLADKTAALQAVMRLLKPGGIFVSSTICAGELNIVVRSLLPLGGFLGLIPSIDIFRAHQLCDELKKAGFHIDYQWQPGSAKSVFIIARKPQV